jgi:hypothetical protein
MKKALAMIALAAICFGSTASAFTRVQQDTTKTKVKAKHHKVKIKKKKKDTTEKS